MAAVEPGDAGALKHQRRNTWVEVAAQLPRRDRALDGALQAGGRLLTVETGVQSLQRPRSQFAAEG